MAKKLKVSVEDRVAALEKRLRGSRTGVVSMTAFRELKQSVDSLKRMLDDLSDGGTERLTAEADDAYDSVKQSLASVVAANRLVQLQNLRMAVLTEAAYLKRLKSTPIDYLPFVVELIEMMDEPDSWWHSRKNLTLKAWLELIDKRVATRLEKGDMAELSDAAVWRASRQGR